MYPQTIKSMLQLTNHFWFWTKQQLKVRQCANLFYKKYGVIKVISIGRWEERGKATFVDRGKMRMYPLQSPLQLWEFLERTWICMLFQYAFWIHSDEERNSKVGKDAITECFLLFHCFQISMPSSRQTGHQRESQKAWSQILLSDWGIVIFLIEYMYQPNEKFAFQLGLHTAPLQQTSWELKLKMHYWESTWQRNQPGRGPHQESLPSLALL